MRDPLVATFSIVGFDPATKEIGIAVQSKFLAVGSVVPWARANVGGIATQSWANTSFGPKGLSLLQEGYHPEEVVEFLVRHDENRDLRQFAILDAQGNTAAYTGKGCFSWAGHVNGQNYSCQGNILVSSKTVESMADSFLSSEGALAQRLIGALDSAQAAGGDSRGKQSAAIYIVKERGGYGGYNDVALDLRVDDHPEPIQELQRLYGLHKLYFPTEEATLLPIQGEVLAELRQYLIEENLLGRDSEPAYTPQMKQAFHAYAMRENFDDRWHEEPVIDAEVLMYMRKGELR
ncbi:DUF1028 domain-containing protein [Ectobacillus ponti]|uniref:DUF1028 domain-containing protein n=1 Tax=Ectobacillus ponti TaxID=2961894 RepID=A0AA41X7N8_9BACI|nr:DUF1028 domain-containing protein [Ectobacillus ponti]MCP8970424.1 DUF1028 domain-containing protein [Ectobacillus ponti]